MSSDDLAADPELVASLLDRERAAALLAKERRKDEPREAVIDALLRRLDEEPDTTEEVPASA